MKANKVCSVDGCPTSHDAKGFCRKHYAAWRRYGDALHDKRTLGAPSAYMIESVLLNYSNDCIFWPFSKYGRGYGQITFGGRHWSVHRLVCEIKYGPPPTSSHVAAHSCGNGHLGCVNPKHVRWATPSENQADRLIHGTDARGEKADRSKLTENDVRAIWCLIGTTSLSKIAAQFGVTKAAIQQISEGKSWGWLTQTLKAKGE
ncbi:HNH endonuclease [Erythrobacter sp. SG61-1L]|uniref:HNH endonuclease n=1 Tax=Erythrobacter sp. SG61-1L TaxID=1603897 RepID=UPI00138F27DF|nr:HNH endonuclease [Erythrobacter sp. SG61-1L]